MMNRGDQTEISIQTVAFGGDGIGRINDLVVFVPFTAEGDVCVIGIDMVKKNFLKGHVKQLLKASPLRTKPQCPYYTLCGGCQYQHLAYEHQLALKQQQLRETLERIGKINAPAIKNMIPSPKMYHYRGKADFQVDLEKINPPVAGFIDTSGATIIPIERCEIVDESINRALADLQQDLAAPKSRLTSDRYTIWSDPYPVSESESAGSKRPPRYVERIAKGKRFQVPYTGFFQVNSSLVDKLVDTVEAICSLNADETLLDTFCGSGLFSILLAPRAKKVYGIDNDERAIRCARINSHREGLSQVTFYQGDAAAILKNAFVPVGRSIDCVILDPPRSGCEKDVLEAVIALKSKKVVYISCNPATQARDLRYLLDRDLSLKYVQPLDMFPQTQHIESIALLGSC